jgi:hypothetical protein
MDLTCSSEKRMAWPSLVTKQNFGVSFSQFNADQFIIIV